MLRRSDITPNRIGLWHKPQTPLFWQYALAAVAAAAGYAVHAVLEAWAGNGLPVFTTFYPAVMVAALLSGIGPGLFTTALSAVIVAIWIMPPIGQFAIDSPVERLALALFCCVGLLITAMAEFVRRNQAIAIDRAEALRESEERLRAIVDTAIDAIIVIDEAGIVQSANPAVERVFGYAPGQIIGKDVSMLMPEPHRSAHRGYIEAYLRTGDAKLIGKGREVDGRRREGKLFPADLALVEWRLDGKRYFTGIIRDISERKNREAQVQFLMHEVNHRAKNILGVVQAIASQTAASEPGDFIARFSERIQALAANQDLLVKNQWQSIEFGDLVRSQLVHFEGLIGSRIEIEGPPLRIAAGAAQPIAMALHELATNAGKYGALSSSEGKASIAWDIARDGTFHLGWTESAGPAVASPTRRGFGTTVITAVPETQLNAEVTLAFPLGGVEWRLTCPAENVLEQGSAAANGKLPA